MQRSASGGSSPRGGALRNAAVSIRAGDQGGWLGADRRQNCKSSLCSLIESAKLAGGRTAHVLASSDQRRATRRRGAASASSRLGRCQLAEGRIRVLVKTVHARS